MTTVNNILYTTDFSEYAQQSLPSALTIAKKFNATLHLLFVIEPSSAQGPDTSTFEKFHAKQLSLMCQELEKTGFTVVCHVRNGDPSKEILWTAKMISADYIILSSHGASVNEASKLGRVAEAVLRNSMCPVFCVHSNQMKPIQFGSMILTTDLSCQSFSNLDHAMILAGSSREIVYLLHVFDPKNCSFAVEHHAEYGGAMSDQLSALARHLHRRHGTQVVPVILKGEPADVLISMVDTVNADLVVTPMYWYLNYSADAKTLVKRSPVPVICFSCAKARCSAYDHLNPDHGKLPPCAIQK